MNIKKLVTLGLILLIIGVIIWTNNQGRSKAPKLYWFIPDGVRAEPELFNIYRWANEGKLPNIKKLMEMGTYGFSRPTFPSHTPTNFATLLTGTYPEIHGVTDGPLHTEGASLDKVAIGGFRSTAKKIPPIWSTLEETGEKVALISVPGSTPPEINNGVVLRGRWGGWGADFHALNFETKGNLQQRINQGRGSRLFFFGPQLTQYLDSETPENWQNPPKSFSEALEVGLNGWGKTVFAYIYDSTDDKKQNYDMVIFSLDKKEVFADLAQGEWSGWQPIVLEWKVENNEVEVESSVKATVVKLDDDGFFRLRLFYDNLNEFVAQPSEASRIVHQQSGPMVDFVDNFPPQLIYYPEDKKTFLDEMNMSFDWHKSVVSTVVNSFSPSVVIHDIYSPNQMLTSRWWMGYIDPSSSRYEEVTSGEREQLWQEVSEMYRKIDDIIGEILKTADDDTYIVFSSDHGAVPLNSWVHINNLFARKGWLKFKIDAVTGEPIIDWENSSVIYLKMAHVYINPDGLDGNYKRASGEEYERLRDEVEKSLLALRDSNGIAPVVQLVDWEDSREFLQLDPERVGDLVIANAPGYGWQEEMTQDLKIFSEPLKTGYKQAIKSEEVEGMLTPFIIAGPGINSEHFLGNKPIEHVDQYPTIMKALSKEIPNNVQGKVLEIFR